uniref:Sodium-coupled neutral amino acid symporter 2 n=1 Tax=Salarias fasciatus TaxID=181472 RepID=A0A672H9D6_SALFA
MSSEKHLRTEMKPLSYGHEDSSSSNSNEYVYQGMKVPLDSQYNDVEAESQNFLPEHNLGKKKYETEYHQGNASFGMSVFNLGNAIMGSGILGLSYAMANTGIALFVILLVAVAIFSLYSVHLLLKTANEGGALVYEHLGYKAFGIPGKLAASCSITMQNIGEWYANGDYLASSSYLGYTSGLSLLCMVFFLIVVSVTPPPLPHSSSPQHTHTHTHTGIPVSSSVKYLNPLFTRQETRPQRVLFHPLYGRLTNTTATDYSDDTCRPKYFVFNSQTVYAVPILTFAFVCHPAILPMYEELKDRSRRRMQGVANVSFLAMFIMYLLAALFGYLTFNIHVGPELLHTYARYYKSDVLLLIVRLAVLTAVTLTVPVVLFPIRTSVNHLLCPTKNFSWVRHTAITVGLLAGTNAMVILVPTIKDIFGFIGASAAAMLIFILPSAFYLKLVKKEPMQSMQKLGAAAFLVLGFLVMIGCMSLIIVDWVHQFSNNKKSDGH